MFSKKENKKTLFSSMVKLASIIAIAGGLQLPAYAQFSCDPAMSRVEIESRIMPVNDQSLHNQPGQLFNNQVQLAPNSAVRPTGGAIIQVPALPAHQQAGQGGLDLPINFDPYTIVAPGFGVTVPTDVTPAAGEAGIQEDSNQSEQEGIIYMTVTRQDGVEQKVKIDCSDALAGGNARQQPGGDANKTIRYVWNNAREKFERQEVYKFKTRKDNDVAVYVNEDGSFHIISSEKLCFADCALDFLPEELQKILREHFGERPGFRQEKRKKSKSACRKPVKKAESKAPKATRLASAGPALSENASERAEASRNRSAGMDQEDFTGPRAPLGRLSVGLAMDFIEKVYDGDNFGAMVIVWSLPHGDHTAFMNTVNTLVKDGIGPGDPQRPFSWVQNSGTGRITDVSVRDEDGDWHHVYGKPAPKRPPLSAGK